MRYKNMSVFKTQVYMRSPQNTAAIRADEEPRCESSNNENDTPGGTSCGVVEKRIEP